MARRRSRSASSYMAAIDIRTWLWPQQQRSTQDEERGQRPAARGFWGMPQDPPVRQPHPPISRANLNQGAPISKERGRGRERERERERERGRELERERERERDKVPVELKALDPRYRSWTFNAEEGLPATGLERYVRACYAGRGERLSEAAVFKLYDAQGRPLGADVSVAAGMGPVWYGVGKSRGEPEPWKLSYWGDRRHSALEAGFTAAVVAAIEAGETVGELKRRMAKHMGIRDPHRIILVAMDGIRRGTLHGSHWQVRQIRDAWLCRWLSIDVNPDRGYVILRALSREYLWYPPRTRAGGPVTADFVRRYLATRVVQRVHARDRSELLGVPVEVRLSLDGEPCDRGDAPVRWAGVYDFELADDDVAELFSREESWLLRADQECSTCLSEKTLGEMPTRVTPRCKHPPSLCRDCLQHWVQSSLDVNTWDRLKCPDCSEPMKWEDVRRHVPPETFANYDRLALRAVLGRVPGFQFCLSTTCGSGQILEERCPQFECAACSQRYCTDHNVPWHEGETCEQYDWRNRDRRRTEQASVNEVRRSSRPCPGCDRDVHKFTGCNHITCVCGHEWCYICLAPYDYNEQGFLTCEHEPGCRDQWAGGDALAAFANNGNGPDFPVGFDDPDPPLFLVDALDVMTLPVPPLPAAAPRAARTTRAVRDLLTPQQRMRLRRQWPAYEVDDAIDGNMDETDQNDAGDGGRAPPAPTELGDEVQVSPRPDGTFPQRLVRVRPARATAASDRNGDGNGGARPAEFVPQHLRRRRNRGRTQ